MNRFSFTGLAACALLLVSTGCSSAAETALPLPDKVSAKADSTFDVGGAQLAAGKQEILWRLPKTLEAGDYWVEFTGAADDNPVEWGGADVEPYQIETAKAGKMRYVKAFSFEVPGAKIWTVEKYRQKQLDVPLRVTRRRSDHAVALKPDEVVGIQARWGFSLTGDLKLIPVTPNDAINLETKSDVPFHLFDDTKPPIFQTTISALKNNAWKGQLRSVWIDALKGEVKNTTRDLNVAPGKTETFDVNWTPPFGAYTLRNELLDGGGAVLLRQERHFTYAPFVDNKALPDDWPFGWHLRDFEPPMPPVGFKWQRVFLPWYEMEPKRGEFDWKEMDDLAARARATNSKLLYVFEGTPQWASPHPELGKYPDRAKKLKTFWGYSPTDPQYARDFLRAFLNRYAPQGDADLIGAIEVLNEPNAGHSVDYSFEQYRDFCKLVYEESHKLVPNIKIVGISQSGGLHMWWVQGVIDAGAAKWMDVASTHNYEINAAVGVVSIASKNGKMRAALDKAGFPNIPIWNTEAGVSSWGRVDDVIVPAATMNARAQASPNFNPAQPEKVGGSWRTSNEWVAVCNMVRSSAQNISMGVAPTFYFKWQAGNFSWVQDWREDGNVTPKMMIPVQAVQSQLWLRYAREVAPPVEIPSPDKDYALFVHRFGGPQGRLSVIYAAPKRGGFVVQDEVAADAPNAAKGEPITPANERERLSKLPDYNTKLFEITLPDVRAGAVTMDILAHAQILVKIENGAAKIAVSQAPVYLIEPNAGAAAWPATK